MRKLILPIVFSAILLGLVFGVITHGRGQGPVTPDGMQILQSESQDGSVREIYAPADLTGTQSANAPLIGFIDSPTAGCYQPDHTQDVCYINWFYMSVDASPNYMIAMTVTINSIGTVARYQGFFQTSMYVPYNMQDRGFQVSCGAPGAGGQASLGNAYAWTIRAMDSSQLKSANYGTVYCPAFTP